MLRNEQIQIHHNASKMIASVHLQLYNILYIVWTYMIVSTIIANCEHVNNGILQIYKYIILHCKHFTLQIH